MEYYLPAIFALIVAAAGWFYIFYSRAASKLAGIEPHHANQLRIRLRRTCGLGMIALAIAFYAGCVAMERGSWAAAAGWMLGVFGLMIAILILALVDVRLTRKLRNSQKKQGLS